MIVNVYLLCSEINGSKTYKVGFTRRDIEDRINELKTGNASDIYIMDSFRSKWGTKIEAYFKRKFKPYNISGEWYDLPLEEVINFNKNCNLIHNNFESLTGNTYLLDKGLNNWPF